MPEVWTFSLPIFFKYVTKISAETPRTILRYWARPRSSSLSTRTDRTRGCWLHSSKSLLRARIIDFYFTKELDRRKGSLPIFRHFVLLEIRPPQDRFYPQILTLNQFFKKRPITADLFIRASTISAQLDITVPNGKKRARNLFLAFFRLTVDS